MTSAMTNGGTTGFPYICKFANDSTVEDVKNAYKNWVDDYEEDMVKSCYVGLYHLVSEFCHALHANGIHQDADIIDVGAGTGTVGEHLKLLGYKNMDALDICEEMLAVAEKKNIYGKHICEGLGLGAESLKSLSYDAAIGSACFTLGHIKAEALREFVSMVRLGGIVAFNARQDVIENDTNGYGQVIQQLEKENVWKVLVKRKIDYYLYPFGDQRALLCYLFVCQRI